MKKKLLALLCVLSVLLGVLAMSATAVTPTEDVFYVGYAKVDINPYYVDGDPDSGIMPVPLRGTGSSATRLAYGYKVDDNGDDAVDENDGLFLTCIAISNSIDSYDDAILLFTMDSIGDMGHTKLARKAIETELGIAGDHVMVSGTHAHSGVDLTALTKSLYLDTEADVAVVAADGTTTQYIAGQTAHGYLDAYRTRLAGYSKTVVTNDNGDITTYTDTYTNTNNYFVKAAQAALNDRAVATISKGQIEVDESGITNADNMNFVRNYVSVASNGTSFVRDAHFNAAITGSTVKGHVSDADQTLHAITFNFGDSTKDPIVLVNWRNHPQFVSTANNYVVSSDYINAFRYQMGLEANGGYRAAFFQGTGGNTQPYGLLSGEGWADNGKVSDAHTYGKLLADVTKVCLTNMHQVAEGEIRTSQSVYDANRVTFTWDVPAVVEAANAANSWPYKYTYTDEKGAQQTDWIINAAHASRILTHYNNQNTKMTMEIDTIMIGPEIAIVTCPGEPFDRYSSQAAEDLEALFDAGKTVTYTDYMDIANTYNDWDKLNTYNSTTKLGIKNAQYGEPLIFGYSNQHVTYIPNALTYHYNANISNTYATQSYENYMTPLAEGEGERMVANLAVMLDEMVNGVTAPCEHCGGEDAFWYPLNNAGIIDEYDHYYLTSDMTVSKQLTVSADTTLCIDLNGSTLTNTADRVFDVAANAELNIFDASDGEIKGTAPGGTSGGVISTAAGSTVNIYGGTLSCTGTNIYGGIIWAKGTVNVYGGTIEAGNASRGGDAICLHDAGAKLNVFGGTITKNANGDCVAFRNSIGTVQVGGDAVVGEIAYIIYPNASTVTPVPPTAETFKIVATEDSPAFTGSVTLNANGITADGKTAIGSFTAQWTADTVVAISDGTEVSLTYDNKLVAQSAITKPAAVVKGTMITEYDTLAQAIANVGDGYILLGADVADLTVSSDLTVDLNGKTITNATAKSGATLRFRDRKTDDYSIVDGVYGKVVNTSGNVEAAENYLAVEAAGVTSYHCYHMELKSVTLRPSANGLYYKSEFLGDSMAAQKIDSFGVALNLSEEPNETNMKPGTYSAFAQGAFGGENTSTILVNIMKSVNSVATNAANAEKPVYGRAYIKFTDGSYQFTESEYYSLRELTELISEDYWTTLDATQKSDLIEMYRKFSTVMSSWDIANIKTAYADKVAQQQKEEDETLKVIVLGNSHSQDSFWQLNEIINAEGIPEGFKFEGNEITKVDLGIMYKSGCYMYQHASNAKNNTAAYTYHKSTYSPDSYESGWIDTKNSTLYDALKDEQWDIVVLQEMNMYDGIGNDYHGSDTQYVVNYVKRTLGYTPKFMWNMVWANPELVAIDGVMTEGEEWLYVSDPGISSWETRMNKLFSNDGQTHHNKMVKYVDNYIVGRYGITDDNVVAPGTTVMYALNELNLSDFTSSVIGKNDGDVYDSNEKIIYRDYTHLSDTARVMAGYLWYAKLFGLTEIDADNDGLAYYFVANAMRAKPTVTTGDLEITETMQANIIEAVNATLADRKCQYTGE